VDAGNPALKLHAVDAGPAGVWVAGDQGALYHLTDRQLWERVVPRAQGAVLTADLVRVHFDDARHGTVLTADGEQWSTSDGAQSWNRSPRMP
jgi:photosystem II stability/assembly factor-like uncharacterized protein